MYGEFSVSPIHVEAAREYIQGQPEHHREEDFQCGVLSRPFRAWDNSLVASSWPFRPGYHMAGLQPAEATVRNRPGNRVEL